MNDTYAVVLPGFINSHFKGIVSLFHDRSQPNDPTLDAFVHSGDYFVTLATMLENLASELPETSVVATGQALSKLADELLYLQKHYKIIPKERADKITELS